MNEPVFPYYNPISRRDIETLIRSLCLQDERIDGVTYTEEEIHKFLDDKHPFLARMISGTMKIYRARNKKDK